MCNIASLTAEHELQATDLVLDWAYGGLGEGNQNTTKQGDMNEERNREYRWNTIQNEYANQNAKI